MSQAALQHNVVNCRRNPIWELPVPSTTMAPVELTRCRRSVGCLSLCLPQACGGAVDQLLGHKTNSDGDAFPPVPADELQRSERALGQMRLVAELAVSSEPAGLGGVAHATARRAADGMQGRAPAWRLRCCLRVQDLLERGDEDTRRRHSHIDVGRAVAASLHLEIAGSRLRGARAIRIVIDGNADESVPHPAATPPRTLR